MWIIYLHVDNFSPNITKSSFPHHRCHRERHCWRPPPRQSRHSRSRAAGGGCPPLRAVLRPLHQTPRAAAGAVCRVWAGTGDPPPSPTDGITELRPLEQLSRNIQMARVHEEVCNLRHIRQQLPCCALLPVLRILIFFENCEHLVSVALHSQLQIRCKHRRVSEGVVPPWQRGRLYRTYPVSLTEFAIVTGSREGGDPAQRRRTGQGFGRVRTGADRFGGRPAPRIPQPAAPHAQLPHREPTPTPGLTHCSQQQQQQSVTPPAQLNLWREGHRVGLGFRVTLISPASPPRHQS